MQWSGTTTKDFLTTELTLVFQRIYICSIFSSFLHPIKVIWWVLLITSIVYSWILRFFAMQLNSWTIQIDQLFSVKVKFVIRILEVSCTPCCESVQEHAISHWTTMMWPGQNKISSWIRSCALEIWKPLKQLMTLYIFFTSLYSSIGLYRPYDITLWLVSRSVNFQ